MSDILQIVVSHLRDPRNMQVTILIPCGRQAKAYRTPMSDILQIVVTHLRDPRNMQVTGSSYHAVDKLKHIEH